MIAPTILVHMADASTAASVLRDFLAPVIRALGVIASLVCAFFLSTGGYHYMTSTGNPEKLEQAKRVIRNALIGLVLVLGAAVLTTILTHAYAGSSTAINSSLPNLTELKPNPVSNGVVDIMIKAVTGFLNNIVQAIAEPFLKALSFFTTSTPLMTDNSAVYNLWIVLVGMADVLFVLVIALLGFHVMGASTFGFDEIEFKHLLPRLGLIFLLVNSSIFAIDGVIEISNAMIHAVNAVGGSSTNVWDVLTTVVKQAGGQGVAALLIMVAFLIFAVILVVYYILRLVTLFIGAVLSPMVLLLWLIPGFRDFSETATKVYLTTIFVLFIHVVILQLAASLFAGMVTSSPTHTPDTLMAMVVGLATLITLLKTQGLLNQLSYVSSGYRSSRKLGKQFISGVSWLGSHNGSKPRASIKMQSPSSTQPGSTTRQARRKSSLSQADNYRKPSRSATSQNQTSSGQTKKRLKTGDTTIAPNAKPQPPATATNPEPFDPTRLNNNRRSKL